MIQISTNLWTLLPFTTLPHFCLFSFLPSFFLFAGTYTPVQFFFFYSIIGSTVIMLNFLRYFMYSYSGITSSRVLHDRLLISILGERREGKRREGKRREGKGRDLDSWIVLYQSILNRWKHSIPTENHG